MTKLKSHAIKFVPQDTITSEACHIMLVNPVKASQSRTSGLVGIPPTVSVFCGTKFKIPQRIKRNSAGNSPSTGISPVTPFEHVGNGGYAFTHLSGTVGHLGKQLGAILVLLYEGHVTVVSVPLQH